MFPSIHPTPGWGHVSVGSWVVTLSLAFLNKIFFSCSSTKSRLTNLFFWRRGLASSFDIPRLISLCNDQPQIATEAITMHNSILTIELLSVNLKSQVFLLLWLQLTSWCAVSVHTLYSSRFSRGL